MHFHNVFDKMNLVKEGIQMIQGAIFDLDGLLLDTERIYEDAIEIDEPEPLISYILSCHGNQNQLLLDQYKEFGEYVSNQMRGGFHITKEAGAFVCRK